MTVLQAILVSLFVYLGAIGSVVGNTLGWYNLGRPLVASFVVGLIMGNVPVALTLGLLLQLANLGSVTPGAAVGWDLSYATYIGVAGALAFHNGDIAATTALMLGILHSGWRYRCSHVESCLCFGSVLQPCCSAWCRKR